MVETNNCIKLMPPKVQLRPPRSKHILHLAVKVVQQSKMKKQFPASQHEQEPAEGLNLDHHASAGRLTSSKSACLWDPGSSSSALHL
jgi:hypothetical protein